MSVTIKYHDNFVYWQTMLIVLAPAQRLPRELAEIIARCCINMTITMHRDAGESSNRVVSMQYIGKNKYCDIYSTDVVCQQIICICPQCGRYIEYGLQNYCVYCMHMSLDKTQKCNYFMQYLTRYDNSGMYRCRRHDCMYEMYECSICMYIAPINILFLCLECNKTYCARCVNKDTDMEICMKCKPTL
jgi:hypothetical protein